MKTPEELERIDKANIHMEIQISKHQASADAAINAICEVYGITLEQLKSDSRQRPLVEIRHIALSYLDANRKTLNITLQEIGAKLNRDHTTIIACRRKNRDQFDINNKIWIRTTDKLIEYLKTQPIIYPLEIVNRTDK